MRGFFIEKNQSLPFRYISRLFVCLLSVSLAFSPALSYARSVLNLPAPGAMLSLSSGFTPVILRGVKVHPENPFQFDFIVDSGNTGLHGDSLKEESQKIIKYFLASLTIPEGELWVNLSPYEKDRMLTDTFGQTEMGRDLLAQDYILKQVTASLLYPEEDLGERFWSKVYQKAQNLYGTTEIPINTFNKVWIIPDRAEILQQNNTALVVDTHLKVMLEEDYLAYAQATYGEENSIIRNADDISQHSVSSEIIREVVLPELEKEVNEGKNFIILRQIYNSLILATWYKKVLKESILNRIYVDQKKIDGVNVADISIKNKIYEQYLEAYKKGVFNFIREDRNAATQQIIPRKYFSGGIQWNVGDKAMIASSPIELSRNGKDGFEDIQRKSDSLSFVSVLFGKVRSKGRALFRAINNNSKELITASLLAAATVFPTQSPAITQDSLALIQQDTTYYYDQTKYEDNITTRSIDRNLDAMLKQYKKDQGGTLIPKHVDLPNLRDAIERLGLNNTQSFEELAGVLKKEFSKQYSQHKAGRIKSRQLAKLELETAQWIMDFLITTTEYDYAGVKQKDKKVEALYRLFIGKEIAPVGRRVHVCTSISEAAVILLGGEFGMRQEAVKTHAVFEGYEGKKYPDKNGLGHVIVGVSTIDGKHYLFDQANRPMQRPHKVIGEGETLKQITETSQAKHEYKRILDDYNATIRRSSEEQNTVKAVKTLHRDVSRLLRNPALSRQDDLRRAVEDMARTIKISFEERKAAQVLEIIMDNLKSMENEARKAFRKKQWREAERLFSLLMRKADEQVEFLYPVLKGVNGFRDEGGSALTAEDIVDNIKELARVAEGNAKAAGENHKAQEKRKQFKTYKKFEARYNSLVGGRIVSSGGVPALMKKMRNLESDVKAQLNNRNLFPEIQRYYKSLMSIIDETIERFSGQKIRQQVRPQTDSKSYLRNPTVQFNALVEEFNALVGNRTISSDEAPNVREGLESIQKKARTQMSSKGLSRSIKVAYSDLINRIDKAIREMNKFTRQQNTIESQFQKYKALENRLNQLVGNKTISSREFGQIRKSLREIKKEANRNMRTPGLDGQIKGFYRSLLQNIEGVLNQISSVGPDLINKDQPLMLAQADEVLVAAVDGTVKDRDWNTGGVDLNNLKIGIHGEDIEFEGPVFDISNPEFGISTDFSGLTIYTMNVTPVINFQMIF